MLKTNIKKTDGTWEPLHFIAPGGEKLVMKVYSTSRDQIWATFEGPRDFKVVRDSVLKSKGDKNASIKVD